MKKAQIWIDTVLYIVIGLAIIGTLLAVMTPKLKQMEDRAILLQTEEIFTSLSSKISDLKVEGNQRLIIFKLKKGEFVFDGVNDGFSYMLKGSNLRYSEPGITVQEGEINILTTEVNNKYDILLYMNKSAYNITFGGKDIEKKFVPAGTDYNLIMQSKLNKNIDFDFV